MNNLALMLEKGFEGQPADKERAVLLFKMAHKLGNLDSTINLAYYYYMNNDLPDNLKVSKALLKHAYRQGKTDAVEYLISFDLIKDQEALGTEIVQQDESGNDLDLQVLAAVDALPIQQKSTPRSVRPQYPTNTEEITQNSPTAAGKAFTAFMRGSNTDERSNRNVESSSIIDTTM